MAWLMVLQATITLWLAMRCWSYARLADEANAALWRALASLRIGQDALAEVTAETLGGIHDRIDEIKLDAIPIATPPACSCKKCREQRALRVN